MAETRPSRRQAAKKGEQRSRVMLDSDSDSDCSSSSERESPPPRRPVGKQPSPEPEDDSDYWIETWWFDSRAQGFTRGRSAKFTSEQVKSANVLRAAAQHMWSQPRMLVRFVVTTYDNGSFSYQTSGRDHTLEEDDVVARHIEILQNDPDAAQKRKLRIIFHEPGEGNALEDVLQRLGFPLRMVPT